MTINKNISLFFLIGCTLLAGCVDIYDQEKYQRPDWLAGKIYTQISSQDDLSVYTECLKLTGYDSILDISGFYTVFAPTDQAFEEWFNLHPEYSGSPENIPSQLLENLVERHILQNGWSLDQLQSLDIYGWIDKNDPDNDKPRGYKRQTIQKDDNKKYYIISGGDGEEIVDSTESNVYRKVFTPFRKYAPVFFDEYFGINDLQTNDYEFYYDRAFETGNVYYGNAKIVSPENFAENGFVYHVDKVTDPLYNTEQILEQDYSQFSFSSFKELFYLFPEFSINMEATNLQPEAIAGGLYDTLFNLDYPQLLYNIQEELTGPNTSISNYTVRYQNGVLVPTNEAFQRFLDEIVLRSSGYPHWSTFDHVPLEVKRVIANSHMTDKPVYRTNIQEGFRNGSQDIITIDEADIIYKYYGSSSTFIGLNKAIVSRAFSSVTGPIYLRPGYSTILYAMEYSKTLPALKIEGRNYSFYVQSDESLAWDSSLFVVSSGGGRGGYSAEALNRQDPDNFPASISQNQLTKMILNQVGVSVPTGTGRKEYIQNLAGNYIVVNNVDNTVSGGLPNTFGYNGDSVIQLQPVRLEEPTDNGITYDVEGWFSTPTTTMYSWLTSYTHFFNLIQAAGLYDDVYYTFPFLTEGEIYTIFIPTAEALSNYNTDTLSTAELQDLVKYHFVRGSRLWTDGTSPDGFYETLRVDESSTEIVTKFSTLSIETGTDVIRILNKNGGLYTEIQEQEGTTNQMIATDTDLSSGSQYDFIITGVIHEIDSVLIKK